MIGSRKSLLGRPPSKDGREDDACRVCEIGCDWKERFTGRVLSRDDMCRLVVSFGFLNWSSFGFSARMMICDDLNEKIDGWAKGYTSSVLGLREALSVMSWYLQRPFSAC